MSNETAITVQSNNNYLAPVVSVKSALLAYQAKKDFIASVLRQGVDYGVIPGSSKPTLYKPGAEKMSSLFGLTPRFHSVIQIEDWTGSEHGGEPFFHYETQCELWRGDWLAATANGSCNSWEAKYRYRNARRTCPKCGKAAIATGKDEYGGGFYCNRKEGGCGVSFKGDAAASIAAQPVGLQKHPNPADVVNTVLKMSQKRAFVAATLIATGVSDYFTQDIEDYIFAPEEDKGSESVIDGVLTEPPADTVLTADGKDYRSLEPGAIRFRIRSMEKALEKLGDGEEKDKLTAKIAAVKAILAEKEEG
jgi:hypothetical protein